MQGICPCYIIYMTLEVLDYYILHVPYMPIWPVWEAAGSGSIFICTDVYFAMGLGGGTGFSQLVYFVICCVSAGSAYVYTAIYPDSVGAMCVVISYYI